MCDECARLLTVEMTRKATGNAEQRRVMMPMGRVRLSELPTSSALSPSAYKGVGWSGVCST
eukprot:11473139-Heterocapsa_arctica.AAC.1